MGRKVFGWVLFGGVLGAGILMTLYVGQGGSPMMIYNFAFLGIMLLICLAGIVGGFVKMTKLENSFKRAGERISQNFGAEKEKREGSVLKLEKLFNEVTLDQKWKSFTKYVAASQGGIGDIEDYINEDEVDSIVHKRMLEMIPDILTSLGILGTFVGLVLGLRDFEPADYTAMTNSVSSLVEGIKVAFLTSIYGLSLSLVYSYNLKTSYSSVVGKLDDFLEEFHTHIMPAAEDESRDILITCQKEQTEAIRTMAKQFSSQLASSFEEVITPSFRKMNQSLDMLVNTMANGQEEMMEQLLDSFLKQLRTSFAMEFDNFNLALRDLTEAQQQTTEYTRQLYENMSDQMNAVFAQEEQNMRAMVRELGEMQKEYIASANHVMEENQRVLQSQDASYRHLAEYMKDAEQSSAKFWVACNQTMQKYVNAAAAGLEGYAAAGEESHKLYEANEKLLESYSEKMAEFVGYQKMVYETMDHVRSLLSGIAVNSDSKNVYLYKGSLGGSSFNNASQELKNLQNLLEEQGERQQELMQELLDCMRDLNRTAAKNKFGIFKGSK
ncbi:MAG: MotA/TolQ/ExbB proton channel family protein [Candidatus Limivivens sp.]|nr:MotA/TolQ/ExbB proton channel family protein [Candidatus Limivivens sp.]